MENFVITNESLTVNTESGVSVSVKFNEYFGARNAEWFLASYDDAHCMEPLELATKLVDRVNTAVVNLVIDGVELTNENYEEALKVGVKEYAAGKRLAAYI